MSLFTIAQEFCLDQHFDETKQPDVRLRIHELFQRTKETVARERQISLEVVLLIGLLETQNSVPKWQLNATKTSAPKGVPAVTSASTLNTVTGLTPRGRKGIPAAVVREVWERDDYCCVNELSEGNRCASKIGLQVDHVRPVSFGQDNRLENLRLLCRQCNIAAAEEILGAAVMERFRWIKSRKGEEAAY